MTKDEKRLTFSQRIGIKPNNLPLQLNSLNERTRNRIYNTFDRFLFKRTPFSTSIDNTVGFSFFCEDLWSTYYGKNINIYHGIECTITEIQVSISKEKYNEVFDLIEFIINTYFFNKEKISRLEIELNVVFKEESVGYQIIDGIITPIISEIEVESVKKALDIPIFAVKEHIKTSLRFLSDKENPSYRNSIKESISAIEGLCQIIVNDKSATLGKALSLIDKQGQLQIHTALKVAFSQIYGYTSDADGIRHTLGIEDNADFEDALYMLVSCSSFINYLVMKCEKTGIDLNKNSKIV